MWIGLLTVCLLVVYVVWVASRALPAPVPVRDRMPLKWYLDERSHTGDLVFFQSPVDWLHRLVSPMTHVALVVMHPVSGEPWVVETHDDRAVEGEDAGVHWYPARERLGDFDGRLVVLPVARARSAERVLQLAGSLGDVPYKKGVRAHVAMCTLVPGYRACEGMMCSEFVTFLLSSLGVLDTEWRCVTPSDLLARAACSGAYQKPYELTHELT